MRIGIVGDVHGHRRELADAVAQLERRQVDRIILLGDLVDRGPDSLGCISLARHKRFMPRCGRPRHLEAVMGNHEDTLWRAELRVPKLGRSTVDLKTRLLGQLRPGDLHWLVTLPIYIRVPMKGADLVCIHGGVLPDVATADDLGPWSMRVRYLDEHGKSLPYPRTSERFWADGYDGRLGFVAFGHESWQEPTYFRHAVGLDGHSFGAVHAVVVSDERSGLGVTHEITVPYAEDRDRRRIWSLQPPAIGFSW